MTQHSQSVFFFLILFNTILCFFSVFILFFLEYLLQFSSMDTHLSIVIALILTFYNTGCLMIKRHNKNDENKKEDHKEGRQN